MARATPLYSLQLRAMAAFPDLMKWERRMWKLKLIGLLMTIVYWAFSLILVYSVMMSIFRYAFGVQLPNPFSIFQAHEHINKIRDEIISQITRSKFLIADFTGHRGGVYFEAGLAMGLRRSVRTNIWWVAPAHTPTV